MHEERIATHPHRCLNHALLTVRAIEASGARLAGWVANCLPPAPDRLEENINTLKTMITAPLLSLFVMPAIYLVWKRRELGLS